MTHFYVSVENWFAGSEKVIDLLKQDDAFYKQEIKRNEQKWLYIHTDNFKLHSSEHYCNTDMQ